MVTVIQQPLLGAFTQQGMSALAQAMHDRRASNEKNKLNQQNAQGFTLLEKLIQEGADPLQVAITAQKYGIDAGPLMKAVEMSQPTEFEKMFAPKQPQQIPTQAQQMPTQAPQQLEPQGAMEPKQETYGNIVQTEDDQINNVRPELRNALLNMSDDQMAILANSKHQRDRGIADLAIKLQDRQKQDFLENRKYHSGISDKYMGEISKKRAETRAKRNDLRNFEYAINNRDLGFFSKDNLANILGRYGKGLVTPEGKLADNAIKNYLVNDLGDVSARGQNMFLEKRILSSLGEVGVNQEANEAWVIAEKGRLEFDEAKVKIADELSEYYENLNGYVPRNIDKLVDQALGPIAEQIQLRQAYRLKELDERKLSPNQLISKTDEQVIPGTPLTKQMAQVFLQKYGENALKEAKNRGYEILTLEEYEAL